MSRIASKFAFEPGVHRDRAVIWIRFKKDQALIDRVKKLPNARGSTSKRSWYVADNAYFRNLFGLPEKIVGKDALSRIHEVNLPAFDRFQEQLVLMGYSPNTQQTYTIEFAQLLYLLKSFPVQELTPERVRSYFLYCHKTLEMSENHLHSRLNAVKFYFEQVLKREKFMVEIPRPKKPMLLPKVLDKNEIQKIINKTENLKHKVMLQLCYGMGLRVSELIALKIENIDSHRMQVHVQGAKGKKDRYVNLPHRTLDDLREYYKTYKPKTYLFEGQFGGQYSVRSSQSVFKQALERAKVTKKLGIHSLRHSYATHLLEHGTDVSFIQKLLGHNDIKTTLIYTHVGDRKISNIQSPLDY
ncbi:MAG: site-specific integrase [Cytophagales bacterium]|nr:site-specific integrase [Cytophagales bacterium]